MSLVKEGKVREMNDFVAGDADYGAFTEQEVVEELSDTESVEDVENEDSIVDSTMRFFSFCHYLRF